MRSLPVTAAVLTLLSVLAYGASAFGTFRDLEAENTTFAQDQAQKLLLSMDIQTARLLDQADTYLRAARHVRDREGAIHLGEFAAAVVPPQSDIHSSELTVLGPHGKVQFTSDPSVAAGTDLSDHPAHRHFHESPRDHVLVGATNDSTEAERQHFYVARPIAADGRAVGGVIMLTIHSSRIAAFYRDMSLGPNSSAAIFTLDRSLIARQPPPAMDAAPLAALDLWKLVANRPEGRFTKRSQLDGIERTFLYKRMADYPLVLVVGVAPIDLEERLITARNSEIFEVALFSSMALIFAAVLLTMERRNRRLAAEVQAGRTIAEQLERSNADLERFAYVASHDLKTPLRVITGYAQMLDRRYRDKLDDEANEYITFLTAGTKRMYRLITDLLHYSRINSQGKPMQPVSSARAVDIALANLKAVIEENQAAVAVGPLPTILADETQLSSLFQNLLVNAVKYHRPGIAPEVKVEAVRLSGGLWRFAVRDNGIGIEPEHFDRIFVIFQRLHTDSSIEGTGIGLALCQRIVNRMGGRLWVESKPGQGSTFFFTARDAELG